MLEKLKEYKEIVAIIVFFLGGFMWLNNQFPTKNDLKSEIGSLNCLVEKYMTLTQLQIRGQELVKQTELLATQIFDREANHAEAPLSPAMQFELSQLKSDYEHNRREYRTNNTEIEKILDELARNVCRRAME